MVPVDIVHDRIKISEIGCKIMQVVEIWGLTHQSSLQNRHVRWGVPPLYKLFSRVLSIRCGTKSTPSKPTQWRCWRLQWRL